MGGGVYLSGSNPDTTIFEVAASDLAAATYIRVEVPAGTAAVINVTGSSLTLGGLAIDLVGGSPETTLWNLPQARTVDLSAIDFQGSMLAPWADVVFHNGQFNGSLFADNITGTGQFNLALLDTDFCVRQRF
jgi:choice-of-anchor A domain-containing protein